MADSKNLDTAYFAEKLRIVCRDVSHYTPQEMARELVRLANVADESEAITEAGQSAARRAVPAQASAPAAVSGVLLDEPQLRHVLKEIVLCYPWGTGRTLVREGSSLEWVSCRNSTGSQTFLCAMTANMVNSAIAATLAVVANTTAAQSPSQGEMDAGQVAASGEAVRQNMELVIARLTDIVDAAETADCDLMESSAKDALPCAKAVLASIATAPSQPEASADKLALTDAAILANETLRHHFGLNGGAGPVSATGWKIINAIIATLKGQQQ